MDLNFDRAMWIICLCTVFCGVFITVFLTSVFMLKQVKWDMELIERAREREHDRVETAAGK